MALASGARLGISIHLEAPHRRCFGIKNVWVTVSGCKTRINACESSTSSLALLLQFKTAPFQLRCCLPVVDRGQFTSWASADVSGTVPGPAITWMLGMQNEHGYPKSCTKNQSIITTLRQGCAGRLEPGTSWTRTRSAPYFHIAWLSA